MYICLIASIIILDRTFHMVFLVDSTCHFLWVKNEKGTNNISVRQSSYVLMFKLSIFSNIFMFLRSYWIEDGSRGIKLNHLWNLQTFRCLIFIFFKAKKILNDAVSIMLTVVSLENECDCLVYTFVYEDVWWFYVF